MNRKIPRVFGLEFFTVLSPDSNRVCFANLRKCCEVAMYLEKHKSQLPKQIKAEFRHVTLNHAD